MLSSSALLVATALTVGQAGEPTSNFEHLKALDWLAGTWSTTVSPPDRNGPVERLIKFEWILNKNVLLLTVTEKGAALAQQAMLWDAAAKQVRFLTVISDGNYSQGTMEVKGDQLILKSEGSSAEGAKTSGTTIYNKKDNDNFVVEFKDGVAGGETVKDWAATLKRVKTPATDASATVEQDDESASNFEHLKALDWLTGKWTTTITPLDGGGPIDLFLEYEWILNKNVQLMTLTNEEGAVWQKRMTIWDAAASRIISFTTSSQGSCTQETVEVKNDRLTFDTEGATAKGETTSGTMVIKKKGKDLFVVESRDRIVGGERQEDWSAELKRVK